MKITQNQLRRIIREEIERATLEEGFFDKAKEFFGKKPAGGEEKQSTLTREKSAMKFLDMYIAEYRKQMNVQEDDIFLQSAKAFAAKGRFAPLLKDVKGGQKAQADLNKKIAAFIREKADKAQEIVKDLEALKELLLGEGGTREITGPGGLKGEFNPYGKMPFESRRRRGRTL